MIVRAIDTFYQRFALPIAGAVLKLSTLFSAKARDRQLLAEESKRLAPMRAPSHPRAWMHAASMGEFEQLVPVIGELLQAEPLAEIIVTLSSPSGLRHARATAGVTAAYIIPPDTPEQMTRWFETIVPTVIVIDRYDTWRQMILEADARQIPVVLINATAPTGSRIPALRPWFADTYCMIDSITAVNKDDAEELHRLTGRADIEVDADTRIDRVLQRLSEPDASVLAYRQPQTTTIVVGSSWPEDEDQIIDLVTQHPELSIRCVIVPHEPSEASIARIEQRLTCTRWSVSTPETEGHLLVDSVGKLLSLYAIADAAMVGGGHGAGVHSVTEPAGDSIPICCGPRIERSRDARDLQEAGVLSVVTSTEQLLAWFHTNVQDEQQRKGIADRARVYVESRRGASHRYAEKIIARW